MVLCRLFIDEVGNGDLAAASDIPNERYLSLTGILTRIDLYNKKFLPELANFKSTIFGPGGEKIVLHRREIVRREGVFSTLRASDKKAAFDDGMMQLFRGLPYLASTVSIDKKQHLESYGEWTRDPYDYCLQALVERYILWMNRHGYRGDVAIEARSKTPDKRVKAAFADIFDRGTENIKAALIQQRLTSREIKFMSKSDNCPAMQITDLLAHPSFRGMKFDRLGIPHPDDYGTKVVEILEQWKYSRHPKTGIRVGWGKKWLPI
jgi:hypothetical protein